MSLTSIATIFVAIITVIFGVTLKFKNKKISKLQDEQSELKAEVLEQKESVNKAEKERDISEAASDFVKEVATGLVTNTVKKPTKKTEKIEKTEKKEEVTDERDNGSGGSETVVIDSEKSERESNELIGTAELTDEEKELAQTLSTDPFAD